MHINLCTPYGCVDYYCYRRLNYGVFSLNNSGIRKSPEPLLSTTEEEILLVRLRPPCIVQSRWYKSLLVFQFPDQTQSARWFWALAECLEIRIRGK